MKKTPIIFCLLLSLIGSARTDESQEILGKIDSYRIPYKDFLVQTKITSFEDGKIVETALFDAYLSGNDKSLVVAKQYKTPGLKILYVNEAMWVHLSGTYRPLRITPIQRLMGEASNGDVARISFGDDYRAERIGTEAIDRVRCHKILLTAKTKSATYSKIILYAREEDYRSVKAEFYLVSGKHFKTAIYEDFKPVAGRLILSKMTIYDELRTGRKTTLEYLRLEEKKLPEKYFNKNYLIHIREL
jgi:hypothetical protein